MESQWIMCDYVRDKMITISLEVLEVFIFLICILKYLLSSIFTLMVNFSRRSYCPFSLIFQIKYIRNLTHFKNR